jgi:hypothetical protein
MILSFILKGRFTASTILQYQQSKSSEEKIPEIERKKFKGGAWYISHLRNNVLTDTNGYSKMMMLED